MGGRSAVGSSIGGRCAAKGEAAGGVAKSGCGGEDFGAAGGDFPALAMTSRSLANSEASFSNRSLSRSTSLRRSRCFSSNRSIPYRLTAHSRTAAANEKAKISITAGAPELPARRLPSRTVLTLLTAQRRYNRSHGRKPVDLNFHSAQAP